MSNHPQMSGSPGPAGIDFSQILNPISTHNPLSPAYWYTQYQRSQHPIPMTSPRSYAPPIPVAPVPQAGSQYGGYPQAGYVDASQYGGYPPAGYVDPSQYGGYPPAGYPPAGYPPAGYVDPSQYGGYAADPNGAGVMMGAAGAPRGMAPHPMMAPHAAMPHMVTRDAVYGPGGAPGYVATTGNPADPNGTGGGGYPAPVAAPPVQNPIDPSQGQYIGPPPPGPTGAVPMPVAYPKTPFGPSPMAAQGSQYAGNPPPGTGPAQGQYPPGMDPSQYGGGQGYYPPPPDPSQYYPQAPQYYPQPDPSQYYAQAPQYYPQPQAVYYPPPLPPAPQYSDPSELYGNYNPYDPNGGVMMGKSNKDKWNDEVKNMQDLLDSVKKENSDDQLIINAGKTIPPLVSGLLGYEMGSACDFVRGAGLPPGQLTVSWNEEGLPQVFAVNPTNR